MESHSHAHMMCAFLRRCGAGNLLREQPHEITGYNLQQLVAATAGYSGSDLTELCREAARMGLRRLTPDDFLSVDAASVSRVVTC